MPISPQPSQDAIAVATQHELSEAHQRAFEIRKELYGWQEEVNRLLTRINDLEDELDFLWNRQE